MEQADKLASIQKVFDDICRGDRLRAQVWKQAIPPDNALLVDCMEKSVKAKAKEHEEHLALGISIAAAQMAKGAQ
jgi:hypothetical protein